MIGFPVPRAIKLSSYKITPVPDKHLSFTYFGDYPGFYLNENLSWVKKQFAISVDSSTHGRPQDT